MHDVLKRCRIQQCFLFWS